MTRMITIAVAFIGLAAALLNAADLGTAFTYQGHLENGSGPVTDTCDFEFAVYEDASGTMQVGTTKPIAGVSVTGGVFTVGSPNLDFGDGIFNGDARWLKVSVCCPATCTPVALSPLVELTPAPHALALPGLYTRQNATSPNLIGGFSENEVTSGVHGATIGGGGAFGATNRVTDDYGIVGGGLRNQAGDGAGTTDDGAFATVGGGLLNTASGGLSTVGGGIENTASGPWSAVGGGELNTASGANSIVGGGFGGTASGYLSTVGGGSSNTATSDLSTVGGGFINHATGLYSTVPGGYGNRAGGDYSFAAGRQARVRSGAEVGDGDTDGDEGTFVWADSTDALFTSTGSDQFLVRATGGVGINTNLPAATLHVLGGSDTEPIGGGFVVVGPITGANISIDNNEIMARDSSAVATLALNADGGNVTLCQSGTGYVGIGDSTPDARLDVTETDDVVAFFNRLSSDGIIVSFQRDSFTVGTVSVAGATVSYNAFTGSHYAWSAENLDRGMLVVLTGENRRLHESQDSETVYGVAPSRHANDPHCLGAYLAALEPAESAPRVRLHQIMAVGNGDMWVVDSGRDIGPGDYLISSDVTGHAILDDSQRFPVGYVIARAAEPVKWSNVSDTIDGRKHKRVSVFFESFERGQAAGLKTIVEAQRKEIDQLRSRLDGLGRAGAGGMVRTDLPLALIGSVCVVALVRRLVNKSAR